MRSAAKVMLIVLSAALSMFIVAGCSSGQTCSCDCGCGKCACSSGKGAGGNQDSASCKAVLSDVTVGSVVKGVGSLNDASAVVTGCDIVKNDMGEFLEVDVDITSNDGINNLAGMGITAYQNGVSVKSETKFDKAEADKFSAVIQNGSTGKFKLYYPVGDYSDFDITILERRSDANPGSAKIHFEK